MEPMIISLIAMAVVGLVLDAIMLAAVLARAKPSKRAAKRQHYAELAADYAEQMGGDARQKLQHALGMFKRLDLADNKRADYSDSEARMAIEAELGKRARS